MDKDIALALLHQYYAVIAANPDFAQTSCEYLLAHKMTVDDIWEHFPDIAAAADLDEPAWL